jgi:hypothetical protein
MLCRTKNTMPLHMSLTTRAQPIFSFDVVFYLTPFFWCWQQMRSLDLLKQGGKKKKKAPVQKKPKHNGHSHHP